MVVMLHVVYALYVWTYSPPIHMNLLLRLSIRYHRLFKQYTYFNKKSFINESSLMIDFNYFLTFKSLSAFKITIIADPVSLNSAIHNLSNPYKYKIISDN